MPSPNYYQGVKNATVQPYEAGLPSTIAGNDVESLQEELQRLTRHTATTVPLLPQVAVQAPQNPVDGMIRYAKAPWNPTGLGNGWVQYVNGSWVNWPNAILGNLSITGTLSVSGNTSLGGTLSVTGNTSLGGNLTISKSAPGLILNSATPSVRYIDSTTNGVLRTRLILADGTAETGANAGSNGTLNAFDDTGTLIGSIFSWSRASRIVSFPLPPRTGNAPVIGNDITNKTYVDGIPAAKISVSRAVWVSVFDLLPGTPTTFFDMPLPDNTESVLINGWARAELQVPAVGCTAYFEVLLMNSAAVQQDLNTMAYMSVISNPTYSDYGSTGMSASFTLPPGNTGWFLRFRAFKDAAIGPFNVYNWEASYMAVQR